MEMNQPPWANEMDGGDGSVEEGSPEHQQKWACHVFKSEPHRHSACMHFKGGRVADVRQHLKRKHPEEAKKMRKEKGGKKRTNTELWYDIWGDLFPIQDWPATPYVGTGDGDLMGGWIKDFIEQWGDEVPDVGRSVLMQFLEHVHARSQDNEPGNMFGRGNVSEQLGQGVQGHIHQLSQPPAGSFDLAMESLELVPTNVGNAPSPGDPMALQVLSNFEAIGQHWVFAGNPDAYPAAPLHQFEAASQLPPNEWLDMGLANPYLTSLAAPADSTSVMNRAWTGNC